MNNLTKTKFVYPTIHYLDVMAKTKAKGAIIHDLCIAEKSDIRICSFAHTYPCTTIKFKEEFHYNHQGQLLLWNTYVDNKLYNIFDYNEFNSPTSN